MVISEAADLNWLIAELILAPAGLSPSVTTKWVRYARVAKGYAALAATGTVWDTVSAGGDGMEYFMLCRVSVP